MATVVKIGRTIGVVDVRISDDQKRLVAIGPCGLRDHERLGCRRGVGAPADPDDIISIARTRHATGRFNDRLPKLTMACGLYDRMLDLYTGDVRPDGITLNFIRMDGSAGAREIFDRMAGNLEFDLAEMSSSEFFAQRSAGENRAGRAAGVPVARFPARHVHDQQEVRHQDAEGP